MRRKSIAFGLCLAVVASWAARSAPDHADITWLSIANVHFDVGRAHILADGYVTRLPQDLFFGGGGGFASTHRAMRPDEAAVREVFDALGGRPAIKLLLAGHAHWDHTFDTGVWARLSGARLIGSATACLQLRAQRIPRSRCTPVDGGEEFDLAPGVHLWVIRWNHSGTHEQNPEQHDPVELAAAPRPDASGALRAGVAEDFPNGGGTRAYLFRVDGPNGTFSWLYQDSAGAADLTTPIVIAGRDFGAPLANLQRALAAARLDGVDLWIGTGGADVAKLVLPVARPKAYLPVHWDGLFSPFKPGPAAPFTDARLTELLASSHVTLVTPAGYGDRWRLDVSGIHAIDNAAMKAALGLR